MYPIELKLCKDFDTTSAVSQTFEGNEILSDVRDAMKEKFDISSDVNVRLWTSANSYLTTMKLLKLDCSIEDERLINGNLLIIETQKPDGSWRREKSNLLASEKIVGRRGVSKPGLCGLGNLGNTCFMNSVIQCLSHCPPLTEYFLNNNHLNDLNTKRPDGMEVELCRAFGEVIKTMWSGEYMDISPSSFKYKVGRFASQFLGYQQHDAQEFLTFLLDGLNEAINRAKKDQRPPAVDNKQDSEKEKSDHELAKETWESYLQKSNSIIVDTFHGLLKSSVVCPVCETVSVKFDPLCYMTLPIPQDSDYVLKVTHVPYDQSKKSVVYRITTSKYGSIKDIVNKIAEKTNSEPENFLLAEVENHHFHKFFSLNDTVDKIGMEGGYLMAYDIPTSVTENQNIVVPVCHWETPTDSAGAPKVGTNMYSSGSMFGTPFVVVLPTSPCTYETVYNLLLERIGRNFTKNPDDKKSLDMSVDDNSVTEGLFSVYLVNGPNPADVKKVPDDGSLLKFPEYSGRHFLALQWSTKSRTECYRNDDTSVQDLLNPSVRGKLQLQDCLSIFMSSEKLGANDTWNCPKCKVSRRATKKFDLWELPNVLIILLKRFTFSRDFEMSRDLCLCSREDKLNVNVEFPMCNLKLNDYLINKEHRPVTYDLFGVINHYGTLSGGHYTAYAKHKADNKWYCFDDSRVYPESEENVMSSSAYILFYMQNNTKKK